MRDYPLTFWLEALTVSALCVNWLLSIFTRWSLRDLPSWMKLTFLLLLIGLFSPMAGEALLALISNEELPKKVGDGEWRMKNWPELGFVAWLSFLSMSLTLVLFRLSDPVKEELLARTEDRLSPNSDSVGADALSEQGIAVRSGILQRLVNYVFTYILAVFIQLASLTTFVFIYSGHRDIPIFSKEHMLLFSLAFAGGGLTFALWLRTLGANRFLADLCAFVVSSAITFWIASNLEFPAMGWVQQISLFSTVTWAFWGLARVYQVFIRRGKIAGGESLTDSEQDQEQNLAHVCPHCEREFVTAHGREIHIGKMHKQQKVPIA